MNSRLGWGLAFGLLAAVASIVPEAGAREPGPRRTELAPMRTARTLPFPPGEVVVISDAAVFERGPGEAVRSSNARVASILAEWGLGRGRRIGPEPPPGSRRRERIWLFTSDRPGFDPVEASRALQASGAVRAACPNYRMSLFPTFPSDPWIFYQWYVDDLGFADVALPFAWDFERGDTSVVIGIMDTGVDTGHPDFAGQIWSNPGEVAGNMLDDDGNGLVDDVQGWDFGSDDADANPEYTNDVSGIDVGFHGTFCAGIAAAATDNGDGIAGAGWNCRIMPLKISDTEAGFPTSAIAGAFAYAADHGASVLSLSFGGPGDPGVPEFYQALVDMATYSGTMCVAAAGNDGDSARVYPAACGNVLAVAATDGNEARATFSNWGSYVDIAAPGSSMWSSICRNYQFTTLDSLIYILALGWDTVNPYMFGDGTSFACPLTAGIAGLVRSQHPHLTPQMTAQHLIATGESIPFDLPIGPKVNAYQAVTSVPTAVAAEGGAPAVARLTASPNPLAGSGAIRFALPEAGRVRLTIYDASGRRVRTLLDGSLSSGPHSAPWDGLNDQGAPLATAVYFARLEYPGGATNVKVVHLGR